MISFADRLNSKIVNSNSVLCAGIDPVLSSLPEFIQKQEKSKSQSDQDFIFNVLIRSYIPVIEAIAEKVATLKINIAFFEQYGLAGLKAFQEILINSKKSGVPVIVDAKRGDIGSTAEAYSKAFLHSCLEQTPKVENFEADALTVNPYLGPDTLEIFLKDCKKYAKGIFVLVKTSNPESKWLQDRRSDGESVSECVAAWIDQHSQELIGNCGISALGAVVGATYPEEAVALRELMPNSFLLIPGFGAQGGAAKDALVSARAASFEKAGVLINASRGLFGVFSEAHSGLDSLIHSAQNKCAELNQQLNSALIQGKQV
jgi:orotidine-5'-phosphate decarboxylase